MVCVNGPGLRDLTQLAVSSNAGLDILHKLEKSSADFQRCSQQRCTPSDDVNAVLQDEIAHKQHSMRRLFGAEQAQASSHRRK